MTLEEAKTWLGPAYVLHPLYQAKAHPNHSNYALVDVRATCERVRQRQSFSDAVEQAKQKLRLVYGKVAA